MKNRNYKSGNYFLFNCWMTSRQFLSRIFPLLVLVLIPFVLVGCFTKVVIPAFQGVRSTLQRVHAKSQENANFRRKSVETKAKAKLLIEEKERQKTIDYIRAMPNSSIYPDYQGLLNFFEDHSHLR